MYDGLALESRLTSVIVKEFANCTHEQFGPLKDRAMAHNNNVLLEVRSSTLSAFEKRQLKDSVKSMLRAMEDADRRLNRTEFCFVGDPIAAPKSAQASCLSTASSTIASAPIGNSAMLISNETDTSVLLDQAFEAKHVHMQNLSGTTVTGVSRPASINISGGMNLALNVASQGPVMIHNVLCLLLLVRGHQLRMHGCTDCVVFVEVSNNRVVLENCRRLHVGSIRENSLCAGLFSVDDFDWPSDAPNPHYVAITSDALLGTNVGNLDAAALGELRDAWRRRKSHDGFEDASVADTPSQPSQSTDHSYH